MSIQFTRFWCEWQGTHTWITLRHLFCHFEKWMPPWVCSLFLCPNPPVNHQVLHEMIILGCCSNFQSQMRIDMGTKATRMAKAGTIDTFSHRTATWFSWNEGFSLHPVRLRHDGQFWAIDNRRLFCYKHCKVERVLVEVIRWEERIPWHPRWRKRGTFGRNEGEDSRNTWNSDCWRGLWREKSKKNMEKHGNIWKNMGKISLKFLGPKMFQSFGIRQETCVVRAKQVSGKIGLLTVPTHIHILYIIIHII